MLCHCAHAFVICVGCLNVGVGERSGVLQTQRTSADLRNKYVGSFSCARWFSGGRNIEKLAKNNENHVLLSLS